MQQPFIYLFVLISAWRWPHCSHGASIIYSTRATKVSFFLIFLLRSDCSPHRWSALVYVYMSNMSAFPSPIEGNESFLVREAICSHLLFPGSAKRLTFPHMPTVQKGLMRPTVNSGPLALEVTRVSPV